MDVMASGTARSLTSIGAKNTTSREKRLFKDLGISMESSPTSISYEEYRCKREREILQSVIDRGGDCTVDKCAWCPVLKPCISFTATENLSSSVLQNKNSKQLFEIRRFRVLLAEEKMLHFIERDMLCGNL